MMSKTCAYVLIVLIPSIAAPMLSAQAREHAKPLSSIFVSIASSIGASTREKINPLSGHPCSTPHKNSRLLLTALLTTADDIWWIPSMMLRNPSCMTMFLIAVFMNSDAAHGKAALKSQQINTGLFRARDERLVMCAHPSKSTTFVHKIP